MKYIKDGAVREKLYRSFVTRAGAENEPLVRRILELKKEQAAILGYQTYAEVSIERKMAESVTAAAQFVRNSRRNSPRNPPTPALPAPPLT